MEKVLVLFPNPWDRVQFGQEKYAGRLEFGWMGDDLFHFPGNVKLLGFDAVKFTDAVLRKCTSQGYAGVLSTDEYIGAIIAAAVGKRLGLPGRDPAGIISAQHKFHSRELQRAVLPVETPAATLLPVSGVKPRDVSIDFPFFVKPVKGTFSVFAAKVDTFEALTKHLNFNVFERVLLRRVTRPFNELLREYSDLEHDANHFIGEELMRGDQVTVDGFAFDGAVEIMGIVDSFMFEGTSTFERFEYPSRLPAGVQERMHEMTAAVVRAHGITHGQFNVELFYDRETDKLAVIEVNPRLSYQFADLYEHVDGSNTYDVLLDLALGRKPTFKRGAGQFKHSASFVMRTFQGRRLRRVPHPDEVAKFSDRYSEATIKVYGKEGQSMKSEMRALGSYRFSIINVAAQTLLDLFAIQQDAIEQLPFESE